MLILNYKENKKIRDDVEPLFISAFPENERPPVSYFFKSLKKEQNNLFAFYDNEMFIGFCYTTTFKDICYIFFLAVQENYRSKGYGSKILQTIKETYTNHVLLLCYEEVDKRYQDYQNRKKREEFYIKNGFKRNTFKTDEYGVIFQTAYQGNHPVSFEDYIEIFKLGFGKDSIKYLRKVE